MLLGYKPKPGFCMLPISLLTIAVYTELHTCSVSPSPGPHFLHHCLSPSSPHSPGFNAFPHQEIHFQWPHFTSKAVPSRSLLLLSPHCPHPSSCCCFPTLTLRCPFPIPFFPIYATPVRLIFSDQAEATISLCSKLQVWAETFLYRKTTGIVQGWHCCDTSMQDAGSASTTDVMSKVGLPALWITNKQLIFHTTQEQTSLDYCNS